MLKYREDTVNVSVPPPGRWVWSDESRSVEFVRLAEICPLNRRGRQSIKKSLNPAHLKAYRSSVMERTGDRVTIEDVKQVAVSLLQENYLLPIPLCFLDVLKYSSRGQANLTSMLAPQADRVMALGEWEEHWQDDRLFFHMPEVHKMLQKHLDKVLNGRTGVRFFFPLCGKAVDMKWLADMGHSVVGVDIAEKAIQQFFEENNMTYSEEPVAAIPGAKVYKSSEKNISLYQCDLYNFSSSIEGQFGAIWDRGSLVAINPGDRQKYAALITSLMAKDCKYLLDTLLYNPELYKGPPFFVPDEQVHSLFGNSSDIELLESVDPLTDRQQDWEMDHLIENVHLISPKSS